MDGSSTESPKAILNTNIVDGFNGIQNTPLIQQLSLTKLGINETTTILKDLNINTISKEINSTAKY
jgi:hypothetical protein